MNKHDIRVEMHRVIKTHDDAIAAIQSARASMLESQAAMTTAAQARDEAVTSAIEANRAALKLLNGLMNEGIEE